MDEQVRKKDQPFFQFQTRYLIQKEAGYQPYYFLLRRYWWWPFWCRIKNSKLYEIKAYLRCHGIETTDANVVFIGE